MFNTQTLIENFKWIIIVALLAAILWKVTGNSQQLVEQTVFLDDKGRVVYPYQNREVKNTITANARKMQICFNKLLETNPNIPENGTINMDWRIKKNGVPYNARIVYSSYQDEQFHNCLIDNLHTCLFPPPPKDMYAEHSFQFAKKQN